MNTTPRAEVAQNIATLLHRLRTDAIFDGTTLGNETADLIEALQAENEGLKREIQNQYRCIESHAEITQKAEDERDALQAQLDAISRSRWSTLDKAPKALEPLTDKEDWDIRGILASKLRVFHRTTEAEADELISLFASMKSRTPLTQPEVVEAFCNTRHNTQYVSVFDAGVRFAEKHHGITKGTT